MANLNILLSIVSDILDRITLKISQSTLSSNKLMGYALILFIKVLRKHSFLMKGAPIFKSARLFFDYEHLN